MPTHAPVPARPRLTARPAAQLAELMRRIQRYEAEGHAQNLLDAAAQGEKLDAQVAAKKAEVKSQQAAREETKSQLHSKDKITLTIAANIELRAEREKERQKRSELDALQQERRRHAAATRPPRGRHAAAT